MNTSFIAELYKTIRTSRAVSPEEVLSPVPIQKRYPRFPQITLPPIRPLSTTLSDALIRRKSAIDPMIAGSVPLSDLSQILGHSLKVHEEGRRPYPSGGSKYPIEIYLISFSVDQLEKGVYHYRHDTHALEYLWDIPEKARPYTYIHDQGNYCEKAAALVIFTALWERSAHKYGAFAYNLALIEAGHIGQNICLSAAAVDIAVRPLCGYKDDAIDVLLELDASCEQPVYAIAMG